MSDINLTPLSIKSPHYDIFYEYPPTLIYYHHLKLPISGELLTPLFIRSAPTIRDGRRESRFWIMFAVRAVVSHAFEPPMYVTLR